MFPILSLGKCPVSARRQGDFIYEFYLGAGWDKQKMRWGMMSVSEVLSKLGPLGLQGFFMCDLTIVFNGAGDHAVSATKPEQYSHTGFLTS